MKEEKSRPLKRSEKKVRFKTSEKWSATSKQGGMILD